MLTTATAWDQLAEELNSAAAAYRSVIAGLTTEGWRGPSSAMMAIAATPYVAWLHGTAAQAEQTASQVRSAATAYQSAFAMTVPPPLVAANRAQLHALIASNFFGQNSPAIAATEAEYERMWAQDASAMYDYAAASSSATTLPQFTAPPDPVAQPAAAAAAQVAPPAQALSPASLLNTLLAVPSLLSATASTSSSSFSGAAIATTNHAVAVNALRDDAQGIGPFLVGSAGPAAPVNAPSAGMPAVSAAMGRASLVNTLSVPQSWAATATPPASATAAGTVAGGATASPAPQAALQPGMAGEAMLGTLAGRGVSNATAKLRRPAVIPRSPAAG